METKECPYCLEQRELNFFRRGNRKCKKCHQAAENERYKNNPEYRQRVMENSRKRHHERTPEEKEKYKASKRLWAEQNKEKLNAKGRDFYAKNKTKIIQDRYEKRKQKMAEDEVFAAKVKLLGCFAHFHRKDRKNSIVQPLVGLNPEEYKKYIESLWLEGMTWENYGCKKGCWNIDHKVPLSAANSLEELNLLFHYLNTQPLWTEENIKKSNKKL
jgi:hypothetical protein